MISVTTLASTLNNGCTIRCVLAADVCWLFQTWNIVFYVFYYHTMWINVLSVVLWFGLFLPATLAMGYAHVTGRHAHRILQLYIVKHLTICLLSVTSLALMLTSRSPWRHLWSGVLTQTICVVVFGGFAVIGKWVHSEKVMVESSLIDCAM